MPVHVEWLLKDYIVYERLVGDVTVDEIQRVAQQGAELMQNATRRLHFIVDSRQMTKTPNLIALRKVNYGSSDKNQGFIIQIAKKGMTQFLLSTVSQWLGIRMYYRNTFAEALALLTELVPDMPDLSTIPDPLDKSK